MGKKVKIAILGYGHIGKKHAEMVSQNQDYELVAMIDPKFSEEEVDNKNYVPYFHSLQDFLNSPLKADVVAICTPNGLHFEQAKTLIEKGIDVIVEKPMTLNSAEAEDLEKLAQEKKVNLFR